jgi:hypothetical protein
MRRRSMSATSATAPSMARNRSVSPMSAVVGVKALDFTWGICRAIAVATVPSVIAKTTVSMTKIAADQPARKP